MMKKKIVKKKNKKPEFLNNISQKTLIIGIIALLVLLSLIFGLIIYFTIFAKDKKKEKLKDERLELTQEIEDVDLNDLSYNDDHYLFAGDVYYLNPYNLDIPCDKNNYVKDAGNNPNQCMKWYEISEDDEYVTLLLNSNLAKTIAINPDVTATSLKYLKDQTTNWDDRLKFLDGYTEDGVDYTGYKSRIFSLAELENLLDNPSYTLDDFVVDFSTYINKYRPWLMENLGSSGERWINGAYFTSTAMKDFKEKNYVVNREGMAFSVSDENTYGIRPIIIVPKSLLNISRTKALQESITYLSQDIFTEKNWTNQNYIEYQFRQMRAMGIKKVYIDMGQIEEQEGKVTSSVVISKHKYASKFGNYFQVGLKYGIEVVPSYTLSNNIQEDNQKIALDYLESVSQDALIRGFKYAKTIYYPREINLNLDLSTEKINFYLEAVSQLSSTLKDKAYLTLDIPTTINLTDEQIQKLASLSNALNLEFYNTMNNQNKTAQDYRQFISKVLDNYNQALEGKETKIYLIGSVLEDKTNHLNFVSGKEAETLNTFIEEVKKIDSSKYTGLGFYTFSSLTNYYTNYNKSDFITNSYNYISIKRNFVNNWSYQEN